MVPDEQPVLPSFITAPLPRIAGAESEAAPAASDAIEPGLKPRRRRRSRGPAGDGAPDASGDE